jgi:hypothetical protein
MVSSPRIKKIARLLLLFAVFFIGLFSYPLAVLGLDFSYMPGDLGDARFINYVLEHGYQFILGNRDSFYDAPFFFPAKNVLAMSDNMLGHLPIYSFFRLLHFSREEALQGWWLSLFALNYFISFICFYKYSKNFLGALLVAYLFSFSILNLVQLNYLQINAKFLLPLLFLFYMKWLETKQSKFLNFFLLVFFTQLVFSIYYSVFMIVFIVVLSITHILTTKSIKPFKNLFVQFKTYAYTFLILLVVVAASIFYLLPYLKSADETGVRNYESIQSNIPEFQTYMSAHPASRWTDTIGLGDKYFPHNYWLHEYFPGIFYYLTLLSIVLLLIIKPKLILSYHLKLMTISFLLLFFISLKWSNNFSPLKYFYDIQFFAPIAFVSRIIFMLDVLFLFIMVQVLSKLFFTTNNYLKGSLYIACFAFIFFDNQLSNSDAIVRIPKQNILNRYKQLEKIIGNKDLKDKKAVAIVYEDSLKIKFNFILDAMLISQTYNLNCINGYSSNAPKYANKFWTKPTRTELNNWCKINSLDSSRVLVIDCPFLELN